MKKLHLLPFAGLLALSVWACRQEEIPLLPPVPDEEETPSVPQDLQPVAQMEIVTDGGVAVDSKDPADYRPCTVTVSGGEGTSLQARGAVRGRGNSTWNWYPKKPYRIKLDESASVLGLPPNRDWVLLADYRDVTHLMNAVGFYLAGALGLPHTNHIRYVTLRLNGEELGLYALTEQVEEGGNRVKLDPEEGILLALDINDGPSDTHGVTDNFYSEVFWMDCAVKFPRDCTLRQRNRIKEEFAALEDAIDACDWEAVQELLDVESMIHYILVQEIICNVEMDNYPSLRSGFIHRYDSDSPWVMGPLWDCDGGFSYNWGDMYDSRGRGHTYFEQYKTLIFGADPYYHRGAYGSTASDFFCRLWGIPAFVQRLQARWDEVWEDLLDGLLDYLDAMEAIIGEEAQRDMDRWKIDRYTHAEEYGKLVNWLVNRFHYLDGVVRQYPLR